MAFEITVGILSIGVAIMIPFIALQNKRLARQRELIAEKRGELAAINREIERLKARG